MIINARASSSVDFGKYLTDRDAEAFTIIEGDPKRIDALASSLLENKTNRKNTHYSFVLSFKEDYLTKDDLFNYYMQFKEEMFKNYSSDELEILSVIHWDDVKPHIHCTVLNASQLDDSRDLRLYRGYVDFKRIEAVQEKINYDNNLASPFDNYNLLSLTKEQKARDWLFKKGKPFYEVADDKFFRVVEKSLKEAKDFDSFISLIEKEFGETIIHSSSKFKKDEFNKNKILNEFALVLKDVFLPTGQNHVYNSKLFDKKWFEKNLLKIQDSLSRVKLENLKFSADKKKPREYEKLLAETTQKHAEHLLERRVGREYVLNNIDKVLDDNLSFFKSGSLDGLQKEACESVVERFLQNCNEKQLEKFVISFPYIFDLKKDFIRYKKNDDENFDIYNEKLIYFLKNRGVSSRNTTGSAVINKKIELNELLEPLSNLSSNKNKAKFRILLLNFIEQERIKNLKELEALLKKLNAKIIKSGTDFKKGDYVTLSNETGSVSVYDIYLTSLVQKGVFLQETPYTQKRDKEINDAILKSVSSSYIKSVYSKLVEEIHSESINSVSDFRLYKSPDINAIIQENGFVYNKNYIDYTELSKKSYERVKDDRSGSLTVEKSLNKAQTGKNLADFYSLRGIKDISIDNKKFDKEIKAAIIKRSQEMGYNLTLWDSNPDYISGTSLLFSSDKAKEEAGAEVNIVKVDLNMDINQREDVAIKKPEIDNKEYEADIVRELIRLNMKNRVDLNRFKDIFHEFRDENYHLIVPLFESINIKVLESGFSEEGGYIALEYKGVKVEIFNDKLKDFIDEFSEKTSENMSEVLDFR